MPVTGIVPPLRQRTPPHTYIVVKNSLGNSLNPVLQTTSILGAYEDIGIESHATVDLQDLCCELKTNFGDHSYSVSSVDRSSSDPVNQHVQVEPDVCGVAIQTDVLLEDIIKHEKEIYELKQENRKLREDNAQKKIMQRNLFMETATGTDKAARKYCGLPSVVLLVELFTTLNTNFPVIKYWSGKSSGNKKLYEIQIGASEPGQHCTLSRFQEYVLTLVRLRLGLSNCILADLFGISATRSSEIFITWINMLHQVLAPMIQWPSREKIQEHMPYSMKKDYPRTRVIVDCSEFVIAKPRISATQNYYKSRNTLKALFGISPSGLFTFVSDVWCGNTSDRYITQHCGILDLIEGGDEVMADQGFVIRDLLTARGATLNTPSFTRKYNYGKGKRLNYKEILETCKIAKHRIRIKRAIQRLKLFKFCSRVMSLPSEGIAEQVVVVAAAFCNFQGPLV